MNLQQPVWRTQWHRVNTTADCFAPERISQPPGFLQKAPDVSPVAEDPEISALLWKSLHKVHRKGKRDFWSCVGASGHCPNPQQGSFSLVSTQFACPAPGANPKPSWVCTSPEQSQSTLPKIQQKMHQVHPIRALWKTSGGYFGEGTDSGAWYTEGFTVFLFKDYFAFLCHKIKTLWLIFYTECLQNVWANLVIYLFFKLDYFHSDSFFNSKNPRIFYKYKSPEWHCWLGLMHIEPLHCFKENLKKKPTKGSHKNTPKQPKTQQKCLPWNQQTFHRKHTMVLPARSRWNILF